ncbi:hypothetical protein BDU57DRAFT_516243 [Ampelomyces quisqualis]|uniref:Uncharacterized protein n=1 Tax=Ampelomyces quisqualis TaxID=50730 RepID=A0A6A5QLB9_AMPQU|nr:hypothetical protein BDU57DRAFT_516243 [Ampelomyces quisqualis]
MSWHLKRSMWAATLERYPSSFKEDKDRSSSLSRRPVRPFLRRPSTNGVTLQTTTGATISSLAIVAIPEVPRVTRTRSRSTDALIPWKQPRRHSFSGSHSPGIHARNNGLPLFTTPRGHQRGVGINASLMSMENLDLSLRSTFSPQLLLKDKEEPKRFTCTMCKYTYAHLECGHRVDDVADTRDCPCFEQHGRIPCDPDNPANRGRVTIRSEDRNGICNKCRRKQREISELDAMRRDEEQAKQQSLAESKERHEAAKAHEERLYKESREEYERLRREREQADIEYMLQKSTEEAEEARLQKEQEDLAAALKASCMIEASDRNVTIDKKFVKETKQQQDIPTAPPPPPVPAQLPSPPATPIRTSRPPRQRPAEKPAAPVDFSLPVGQQEYSAYTIGGRRAPVHESQKQQAAKYLSSPVTPLSPAPVARLGTTIQPGSPSPRSAPGAASPIPVGDLRSGLRRTGGPRNSVTARTNSDDGSELRAQLARRRTREPKEDTASRTSITPSESASNMPTRAPSPTGSDLSTASTVYDNNEAHHMVKPDFDEKRRKGWSKN